MAEEDGVLGTPSVRVNDLSGRIAFLNEIENIYKLGNSHKSDDIEGFFSSIQKWLDTPDRESICTDLLNKMLTEKINYTQFLTWFIESYPESTIIMHEDPDYQWRFR